MKKIFALITACVLLVSSMAILSSCGEQTKPANEKGTYTKTEDDKSYTLVTYDDNTFKMTVTYKVEYSAEDLAAVGITDASKTLKGDVEIVYTGTYTESKDEDGETLLYTSLTYKAGTNTTKLEGTAKSEYLTKLDALLEHYYDKNIYKATVLSTATDENGKVTDRTFTLVESLRNGTASTIAAANLPAAESVAFNADNTFVEYEAPEGEEDGDHDHDHDHDHEH